jgi:hypothetical protein
MQDLEHKENIVQVPIIGRVTIQIALNMVSAALLHAAQAGSDRFLVDCRGTTVDVSTVATHDLATKPDPPGAGPSKRVAVLPPQGPKDAAEFDSFEKRMVNSGFQVRLFSDSAEAMRWLSHPSSPLSAPAASSTPTAKPPSPP